MKNMLFKIIILFGLLPILMSCNSKVSLIGKKIYLFEPEGLTFQGISRITEVSEIEINFISGTEIEFKKIATYGTSYKSKISAKRFNYSYVNDSLTIPNLGISATKLVDNGAFYTSNDGTIYYKESILNLSEKNKLERLEKVLTNYSGDIKSSFLGKEIVYNTE